MMRKLRTKSSILNLTNTMSSIQKLQSTKEKPMIAHLGFIYTREKESTTKIIIRCQNRTCIDELYKE